MTKYFPAFIFVFIFGVAVFAQDAPPTAPAAAPAPPTEQAPPKGPTQAELESMAQMTEEQAANLSPANAAFQAAYKNWLVLLKELRALKLEYQQAAPDRSIAIKETYDAKVAQGTIMQPELTDLALKAFEETPYKNPYVFIHLFGLIDWENGRENYEKVVELFQKMEKHGIPETHKILYAVAGLAAVKSMQFDLADQWLKIAGEEKMPELDETLLQYFLTHADDENRSNRRMLAQFPMLEKSWEKEAEIRKKEEAETDPAKQNPQVLLKTNKGDIVLELFEDDAPNTVASFISLVNKGFYKNVVFHRVLPNFMAQGGDPTGTGTGGPGYVFDCECYKPDYRRHFRGSISMANAGPNTNGSQFFLTFVPTSMLDGRHTVFGRIVSGMNVLSEINRVDPEKENQREPDMILEAKVLRSRPHEYVPKVNTSRR